MLGRLNRVPGLLVTCNNSSSGTRLVAASFSTITSLRWFASVSKPTQLFRLPPPNWTLRQRFMNQQQQQDDVVAADIEEVHHQALCRQSTTYTDPVTGFLAFTELAHLQRGTCCGNQCRHCPYGWENVRSSHTPRTPKVKSGDKVAIQVELDKITHMAQQANLSNDNNNNNNNNNNNPIASGAPKKTGGRHGGRLTQKNVPYTRGGDKGTSVLLTGERRSKADQAFEAMGTVDELCCTVGVVHAQLLQDVAANQTSMAANTSTNMTTVDGLCDQLLEIMSRLFDIGSHVAKPVKVTDNDESSSSSDSEEEEDNSQPKDGPKLPKSRFKADGIGGGLDPLHVQELEDWIDQMTEDLPQLTSFLLPTGCVAAAQLHVARTVCRRAERTMIPLVHQGVCDPTALQYVNRLSDYLFSAARWVNLVHAQGSEIQYRRPNPGSKQRQVVVAQSQEKK